MSAGKPSKHSHLSEKSFAALPRRAANVMWDTYQLPEDWLAQFANLIYSNLVEQDQGIEKRAGDGKVIALKVYILDRLKVHIRLDELRILLQRMYALMSGTIHDPGIFFNAQKDNMALATKLFEGLENCDSGFRNRVNQTWMSFHFSPEIADLLQAMRNDIVFRLVTNFNEYVHTQNLITVKIASDLPFGTQAIAENDVGRDRSAALSNWGLIQKTTTEAFQFQYTPILMIRYFEERFRAQMAMGGYTGFKEEGYKGGEEGEYQPWLETIFIPFFGVKEGALQLFLKIYRSSVVDVNWLVIRQMMLDQLIAQNWTKGLPKGRQCYDLQPSAGHAEEFSYWASSLASEACLRPLLERSLDELYQLCQALSPHHFFIPQIEGKILNLLQQDRARVLEWVKSSIYRQTFRTQLSLHALAILLLDGSSLQALLQFRASSQALPVFKFILNHSDEDYFGKLCVRMEAVGLMTGFIDQDVFRLIEKLAHAAQAMVLQCTNQQGQTIFMQAALGGDLELTLKLLQIVKGLPPTDQATILIHKKALDPLVEKGRLKFKPKLQPVSAAVVLMRSVGQDIDRLKLILPLLKDLKIFPQMMEVIFSHIELIKQYSFKQILLLLQCIIQSGYQTIIPYSLLEKVLGFNELANVERAVCQVADDDAFNDLISLMMLMYQAQFKKIDFNWLFSLVAHAAFAKPGFSLKILDEAGLYSQCPLMKVLSCLHPTEGKPLGHNVRWAMQVLKIVQMLNRADQVALLKQVAADGMNILMMVLWAYPHLAQPLWDIMKDFTEQDRADMYDQCSVTEGCNAYMLSLRFGCDTTKIVQNAQELALDHDITKQFTRDLLNIDEEIRARILIQLDCKKRDALQLAIQYQAPDVVANLMSMIEDLEPTAQMTILTRLTDIEWASLIRCTTLPMIKTLVKMILDLEESAQKIIFGRFNQIIWANLLVVWMKDCPQIIKLFLLALTGLDLVHRKQLLQYQYETNNSIVLILMQHVPQFFEELLKLIQTLTPADQAIIFRQIGSNGWDCVKLALVSRQELVVHLFAAIFKLDQETQSLLLRRADNLFLWSMHQHCSEHILPMMEMILKLQPETQDRIWQKDLYRGLGGLLAVVAEHNSAEVEGILKVAQGFKNEFQQVIFEECLDLFRTSWGADGQSAFQKRIRRLLKGLDRPVGPLPKVAAVSLKQEPSVVAASQAVVSPSPEHATPLESQIHPNAEQAKQSPKKKSLFAFLFKSSKQDLEEKKTAASNVVFSDV